MLLYGDIVKEALEQEALPILREAVDSALTARFGEEWYSYFARAILEGYTEFKKIDAFVAGGKGKAIEALDIGAICYLVMPYDRDLKMYLDGAMPMMEDKFGLPHNPERLKRLRTIQNNVTRNKLDVDMEESRELAESGEQERIWLTDIEKILQEFRPECSLSEYVSRVEAQSARRMEMREKVEEAVKKRPSAEEVREAYTKIYSFAFSKAPVGKAVTGKAPWASLTSELDNLPWPSVVSRENEQKKLAAEKKADMVRAVAQQAANMAQAAAQEKIQAAENVTDELAELIENSVHTASEDSGFGETVTGQVPARTPVQINIDDFVKPDPAQERPMPGTAPNEETDHEVQTAASDAPVNEDNSGNAEAAENREKGVGRFFGWLKGKK